jgi:hypothetical protein
VRRGAASQILIPVHGPRSLHPPLPTDPAADGRTGVVSLGGLCSHRWRATPLHVPIHEARATNAGEGGRAAWDLGGLNSQLAGRAPSQGVDARASSPARRAAPSAELVWLLWQQLVGPRRS